MFYECKDSGIESYADGTTPNACASDINTKNFIFELQIRACKLFPWFDKNHIPKLQKRLILVEPWWNQAQLKNSLGFGFILT